MQRLVRACAWTWAAMLYVERFTGRNGCSISMCNSHGISRDISFRPFPPYRKKYNTILWTMVVNGWKAACPSQVYRANVINKGVQDELQSSPEVWAKLSLQVGKEEYGCVTCWTHSQEKQKGEAEWMLVVVVCIHKRSLAEVAPHH